MPKSKPDKRLLLSALANHVLQHGLNSASLRPLAAAAGTSDRMLIYHFGSKDALIDELLVFLGQRMAVGLDAAIPPERFETEGQLVATVVGLMRSDAFSPYIRVWLDIVSAAAQGSEMHRNTGSTIIGVVLEWLAIRHPDGHAGAPFALTFIEGTLVMDAVGRQATTDHAVCSLGTAKRHMSE